MRTCPVCEAKSFDDMEICFGCMHRFSEPVEADFVQSEEGSRASLKMPQAPLSQESQGLLQAHPIEASLAPLDPVAVKPAGSDAVTGFPEDQGSGRGLEPAAVLPVMGSGYNLVISLQPA